jgi:long-subunit fatty acid transport protein
VRTTLSVLCIAAFIFIWGAPVCAHNGIEDIAVTVRQLGRGGAFIATEPDPGALMGNPAALAFLDEGELLFDVRNWHSSLDYTGALNGIGQEENYVIPNLGYAEPASDRLAWGAGVFTIVNTAYRVNDYDLSLLGAPPGTTDSSSSKIRFVVFSTGAAYKLNCDTSIGAAVQYSNGSADFQAYNALGNTVGFGLSDMDGEGYSMRMGLYHRASENTTVGAYWRSRSHLEIDGGVLSFGPLNPAMGAVVNDVSIEGYSFPEQYGVGLSQRLNCEWTVLAEYRKLLSGKGPDTVYFVPPQGDPIARVKDWSDQDVYVLGGEYRPNGDDGAIWRLGANYAKSPVPDHTLNPVNPAINEWHYTAGWEREISDDLSLVAGALYAPGVTRTSSADNPYNMNLGGGQPFSVALENWEFGVGFSWTFGGDGSDEPVCDCPDCSGGGETCVVPVAAEGDNVAYSALKR